MSSMQLQSVWFGLLLLLRATFAQSAPNGIFSDGIDNEEELIDKLATYVAMGRAGAGGHDHPGRIPALDLEREDFVGGGRVGGVPDDRNFEFDRPIYSDFDLRSDYGIGGGGPAGPPEAVNNLMLQQSLRDLPKQFAYKPDDVRFYMNPDEFPVTGSNSNVPAAAASNNQISPDSRPPTAPVDDQIAEAHDDLHAHPHMKKSRDYDAAMDARDADGVFEQALQPQPGNVMASAHDADKPGPLLSSLADGQSTFSIYYVALVAALSSAGVVGLVGAGICWYRIHERVKAAAEVDYPAYGVTGPSKDVSPTGGDRKLAQSAHMYHYQHQKQQMAALQKSALEGGASGAGGVAGGGDKQGSDVESEDDNEDGDYTVYECPGLAPAGDMEVKNPLFDDEPTPATPSQHRVGVDTELASEATE